MSPRIRDLVDSDLDALVAINDAAHPAVPITSRDELASLAALSSPRLVVELEGEPAGFVLAMPPGLDYASENYRWFSERAERLGRPFVYVDRIVLAPRLQGRGIGVQLYAAVFEAARAADAEEVLCEVNLRPPNPGSLAFHLRLGFAEVGRQSTKGGAVEVALLAAEA